MKNLNIHGLYECYGHCRTRLRYHIILVTKYRRKCLEPIKDSMFQALKEAETRSHLKIHYMNIDNDHIHLLVSFPPDYSISQTIKRIKQLTTNYLYRYHKDYLKRFYVRRKKVLWSDSYFCSTIGTVSESNIKNYIRNQNKTFKATNSSI